MKVSLIILCAVFYAHVARGLPTETKKEKPQADPAPVSAPVAEKPDTCKATIDGQEQTLQPGDRYCLDEKTHRVCNWGGEWIDNPCPENSKCLKSKDKYQVLCRIVNRNPPQAPPPQDSDVQPSGKSPEASNPAPPPKPETKVDAVPPPAPPPKEEKPQPEPPKPEQPHVDPVPPPAPKQEKPEVAPVAPAKPETCKATVDGKEQILQPGDRYCLDDNTNRVCNWGEFVDYACPSNSKCLKSPDKWQVLCRIINKNPAQNVPGADGH